MVAPQAPAGIGGVPDRVEETLKQLGLDVRAYRSVGREPVGTGGSGP